MKDDFWLWVVGALVLCFLFEGEPDVWDKLRERIIQGEHYEKL
jgi:hypothetical protein